MIAPICLFTYNRLFETQQTVEALKNNHLASQSELILFSDGPKNELAKPYVMAVREYLASVKGFKSIQIIESDRNKGLANSIIEGVTEIITKYGKVIVLEDDLITTKNFLNFINQALDYYQKETNVQSVNGFSLELKNVGLNDDVYFQTRPFSWGWGTWSDRWDVNIFNKDRLKAEIGSNPAILKDFKRKCGDDIPKMLIGSLNNTNDSWYVRWAYSHYSSNRFSVFPTYSLIRNIGHGAEATHCKGINSYPAILINSEMIDFHLPDFKEPDQETSRKFLYYFSLGYKLRLRIEMMKNKTGRRLLLNELKTRLGLKLKQSNIDKKMKLFFPFKIQHFHSGLDKITAPLKLISRNELMK